MAEGFTIKIEGIDLIKQRLRLLPQRIRTNIMRGAMRAAARVVQLASRAEAPKGRTGNLRRSISISTRARVGENGSAVIEAKIKAGGSKAWYANIVEGGAKPHEILPRRATALAVGPALLERVDHPGFAGRAFMQKAREKSGPAANNAFRKYVDQRVSLFWQSGR